MAQKFTLIIDCDNAAFEDDALAETARIVKRVWVELQDGRQSGACRDINGNRVGEWDFASEIE